MLRPADFLASGQHGWVSDGRLETLKPAHWDGVPVSW
jgi:hypothetical protein